jgi:hypothetical protein
MADIARIREICKRHPETKIFVEPIPAAKLSNAVTSMRVEAGDRVLGLIDTTVFGGAREGLLVCERGIYWKNYGPNPEYLTWEEFRDLTLQPSKNIFAAGIRFSDGRRFQIEVQRVDAVLQLLLELQALAKETIAEPAVESSGWFVAVGQKQFGPYDLQTLRQLVAAGQLDPAATLAWRDGMAGWQPLASVSELQFGPSRPAAPPPLPSSVQGSPPLPTAEPAPVVAEIVAPKTPRQESEASVSQGRVDLNNAALDDLLSLPGLTLDAAKRLLHERQLRLGFQTVEDVGAFLDLQPHVAQRLRERTVLKPFVGSGLATSARGRVIDY